MSDAYGPPEILTPQSVFDKVVVHLLRQGRPSIADDHNFIMEIGDRIPGTELVQLCLYRGPQGTACAVGCLIPDDRYHPSFENTGLVAIPYGDFESDGDALLPAALREPPYDSLLADLQVIHDNAALTPDGRFDLIKLRGHLRRVASRFGLKGYATYWSPGMPSDWDADQSRLWRSGF